MHATNVNFLHDEPSRIATRLERIVSSIFSSINARLFNTILPPWDWISADFTFASTRSPCQTSSKSGFISHLQGLTSLYPSLRIEVSSISTHVYKGSGYAEVYANVESFGNGEVPPAVKGKTVAVFEFRPGVHSEMVASRMTWLLGFEDDMKTATSAQDKQQCLKVGLEQIVSSIFNSVNSRSFEPAQSHWMLVAPDFSVSSPGDAQRASTKGGFIDYLRLLTETYPSFKMNLVRMETYVYKQSGYAEVYADAESIGGAEIPMAMKRKSVGVYEFRQVYGEVWLATRLTSIMGAEIECSG